MSVVNDASECCRYEFFMCALANETRQSILKLLLHQEMSVGKVVEAFPLSQPTISHHLAILKRAGLVLARREGKQVYYTANRACVKDCCQQLFEQFERAPE